MCTPGTLKPRAIAAITALQGATDRTLTAATIARRIGDADALHVVQLMYDMADLGLVERARRGIGYRSSWRLLVAGPVAS